jgi:hypothetical protein
MDYISSEKISSFVDISEDYLFKVFGSCGLKKMTSYSLNHIRFVVDNLVCGNYRKKVIVQKLTYILNSYEKCL